jgi:hypothetical protein
VTKRVGAELRGCEALFTARHGVVHHLRVFHRYISICTSYSERLYCYVWRSSFVSDDYGHRELEAWCASDLFWVLNTLHPGIAVQNHWTVTGVWIVLLTFLFIFSSQNVFLANILS